MVKFLNKIFNFNNFLNVVQRNFGIVKTQTHHTHKRIIHHVYRRKHHWKTYVHILLLLLLFYFYNIITFNQAEDLTVPMEEAPIVIENEPQIVPDQIQEEVVTTGAVAEQPLIEAATGEVEIISGITESGVEIIPGIIESGAEFVSGITQEMTGEVLSGTMLSGESLISSEKEFFSGVLSDLSGNTLYNLSGEIVGEVNVQSGEVFPVDMSGVSLITQELSVLYPQQKMQINGSGFIQFDSLESVLTTGGAYGLTYCSRITYENISSILKAGIWTWRETNDYVLQGDTDQILEKAIEDKTVIEVSLNDLSKIFSGNLLATTNQLYDMYITFIANGKKVYHRISFVYAYDQDISGRYVLDPLRGARTTAPQKISDYLGYYTDETDVHRYIGQGYSPSVLKAGFTIYENILQLFQQISETEIATGEILSGETLTGEILTGEILTGETIVGEQTLSTGNIATGNSVSGQIVLTGTIPETMLEENVPTASVETPQVIEPIQPVIQETPAPIIQTGEEEIVIGYFDRAYDKGSYDAKLVELQKMFTWMNIYSGTLDGVYSNQVIEAIYTYQLQKGLLIGQENNKSLRGYLGPKTRKSLNQTYTEYQMYEILLDGQLQKQQPEQTISTGQISTETGIISEMIPITGQEIATEMGVLSGVNVLQLTDPLVTTSIVPFGGEVQPQEQEPLISTGTNISGTSLLTQTGIQIETQTGVQTGTVATEQKGMQTGTISPVVPEEQIFEPASILSGVNIIILFDPLANPLFFSGLLNNSGYQSLLSGLVYTAGMQIGLTFTTGTQEEILEYLRDQGYETGMMTLVPLDNKFLVGDQVLDFEYLSGKLLVPVVLQSTNELSGQIAEVQIPEGALLKTADGEQFTGELAPPVFEDPKIVEEQVDQDVISVIDVGSEQSIQFEDLSGNALYATFRVPVPGMNIGDTIDVNYSEDGETWTYLNSVNVQDIDGDPYAIFYANHFTTFYLGVTTGTFMINNDAIYTTGLTVTLNNNVEGAEYMRLGNTIEERDSSDWIKYDPSYSWNLTGAGGDGIKRVYAQFSGIDGVRGVSDSIIYAATSGTMASGLQLYLNGNVIGTRFYDAGYRNLLFTGINGAYKSISSGEEIMMTDGVNDYIEGSSGFITNYPFTISAWVKPSRVNATQTLVMFGNSATNTTLYGIRLDSTGHPNAVAQNTSARSAVSTSILVPGKWYHIIGVFNSSTSRTIYVDNANPITNTNNATFSATNQRRRIGRHPGISTTNYYSGAIDEVRVYDKALTPEERQSIYMITPTFDTQTAFTGTPTLYGVLPDKISIVDLVIGGTTYATTGDGNGKWKTLPMNPGLSDGTYDVTINYTNVYGKTGTVTYTNGLVISLTGVRIEYSPFTWTSGNVLATLTGIDPTYMIINNFGSELFTFTGNGIFEYQFVDKQGTTGMLTAVVDWIDKSIPTFTGIVPSGIYSGGTDITIDFADENLSGAILSGLDNSYYSGSFQTGTIQLSGGTYSLMIYDKAGNSTGANFVIARTTHANIMMKLKSAGYMSGIQTLVSVGTDVLVGTGDIDLSDSDGDLLVPVVMQSSNDLGGQRSEVELPEGVKVRDKDGKKYKDKLRTPVFQQASNFDDKINGHALSVIDVGNNQELRFKDNDDNPLYATFRMPVPGKAAGDLIDIYYSEDGNTFGYMDTVSVKNIGGEPYVTFMADHFTVLVTSANSGTNISADKAANSIVGSGWTAIGKITIQEQANTDFAANQTNATVILTLPNNRKFKSGSCTAYAVMTDITAATSLRTDTTLTVTFTTDSNANALDSLTRSGCEVQAITGSLLPSSGNILRTSANPGTATIVGITNGVTNFGSLSQIPGSPRSLVITLSGQTFSAITGNIGNASNVYATSGFVIPKITAIDQFWNIATSYNGSKILSYTGAGGTPSYTTGVSFTNGQSTTTLNTALTQVATGVTLKVTDGTLTGIVSSSFSALALPLSTLSYSPMTFYENSVANNGSISGNIVATLSTGSFSSTVASNHYVAISNIPTGLTGVFTLSGTNKLIITLSGNATNHTVLNSTGNLIITFLTGAFSGMNPSDVVNSTQTGIAIQFIDEAGYVSGQQLWLKGILSGGQFYDYSPIHRTTTGYGSLGNSSRSGETIMGPFNGSSQYVDIGTYTLANYTMSARIYRNNTSTSYQSIIAHNGSGTAFEISVSSNLINLYSNGSLKSTFTLGSGVWYHIAVVKDAVGTKLYINGVYNTGNNFTGGLISTALAVGRWDTSQYRTGDLDEVKIYDNALSASQVESLYMSKPSFTQKTTNIAAPDIKGSVSDPKMAISLTINGVTYPATNNQDGTWTALSVGPFASGTYDVQLNYTNIYGRTGMLYYTGGLTVNPTIYINYAPATSTSGNVVATVTGYNASVFVANNGGSPSYTFTGNGQFTFRLQNTSGDTATITAIVSWIQKAWLSYSTGVFYENSGLNDGSIANTITATLQGTTFSSNLISSGLIQLTNIPAGLTGHYTLSGNTQLIVGLTGKAINHANDADISNVGISFLSGAFVTYPVSEVGSSTKTGISIDFLDNPIGSGTLRLDGSYLGNRFYDLSSNNRITTGTNVSTASQSGETVMLFNNASSYIDIGNYTLSNYTISAWFKANTLTSYDTIIGNKDSAVSTYELIDVYGNKIDFYSHGGLTSTETIATGKWYHVALVQNSSGTSMYINGVFDKSTSSTLALTNAALAVGADIKWSQWRDGNIDEVHIYDTALSASQVASLYLQRPNYISKTVNTGTTTLTGLVNDPKMYSISVTVSGTTYPGTINAGTRTTANIGPLASGTYDVQLNYMNVYGKTGSVTYTGGLVINPIVPVVGEIQYSTTGITTGSVVSTLICTGCTITNNSGSNQYTFTSNGSFIFEYTGAGGATGSTTATVTWIKKAVLNYSTVQMFENQITNNGSINTSITITLSSGAFSTNIVTGNYIVASNVPSGLTGVFVLNGTNKLAMSLSGNAINHASGDSISNMIISFLTGAFSGMNPSDVANSIQTGISIRFYDEVGYYSGQQLWIKGNLSGTEFYDYAPAHHTTTAYNVTATSMSGENVMLFDSSSYIDVGDVGDVSPNITVAAWINGSDFTSTDSNINTIIGKEGTSFILRVGDSGIEQNRLQWVIAQSDGTQIKLNASDSGLLATNTRYYVVATYDIYGNQKLYINGKLDAESSSADGTLGNDTTTTKIGRSYNTNRRWSGYLDEVQIYDATLQASQIKDLYMLDAGYISKTVNTGTTTLTGLVNDPKMYSISVTVSGTTYPGTINAGTRTTATIGPLMSGTYDVQLNYMNVYGKTGTIYYTGGLTVSPIIEGTLTITGPVNFDFGIWSVNEQAFSIEKTFSGSSEYFEVIDEIGGDPGYYTTISMSDITNGSGDSIPYTAIAIKALNGLETLAGTTNPRVYSAITGTYQYFSGAPLTFIKRNAESNGGVTGTYGVHTVWKIDVPTLQNVGTYTGVITYTLY